MSVTVSDWAFCCAHCGWIESSNMKEIESDESCTIGAFYTHNSDCRARENVVDHKMFMALWNARIHMDINDVLLRRAEESLNDAMIPYIKNQLSSDSFFVNKEPSKFWMNE